MGEIHNSYLLANRQQSHLESAVMTEVMHTTMVETVTESDSRDAEVRSMLLCVVRSLVDEADRVELLHVAGEDGMAFQVRSAASDVGKLIGKSGRTARAIRTILSASAARNGRRYSLDIVQDSVPQNGLLANAHLDAGQGDSLLD
jgi:predicted RNA-binding protein YlqC (UPF0109 family)